MNRLAILDSLVECEYGLLCRSKCFNRRKEGEGWLKMNEGMLVTRTARRKRTVADQKPETKSD